MAKVTQSLSRSFQVVWSVAGVSYREIIRDKILYNILVIAVLLLGLGFLASRLTFVRPDRVVLDFGVSAVDLSLVTMAALIGASLLNREIERRTIFLALSRPISRFQFVAGKFIGLIWVLFLNWVLVSAAFLGVLWISGGVEAQSLSSTLLVGLLLLFFQGLMMASVAIFFSTFSTTSLSAVLSIGIYLIGNNVSQITSVTRKLNSKVGAVALDFLGFIIPNFEHFTLGTKITYGIEIPGKFVLIAIAYALAVSATLILLAGLLIQKKEA